MAFEASAGGIGKPSVSTSKIPDVTTISTGAEQIAATATQKYVTKTTTKKTTTTAKNKKTTTTTAKKKTSTTKASADIVKWSGGGGISFYVKPKKIKGVKDINIKASADTEEKANGGEKYTSRKNKGGLEISMTAILNSTLGIDVEAAAKAMLEAARKGDTGYFYVAGKKLFTPKFMMTDANAKDVLLTGTGKWASCTVDITLKQSSKYNGSTAASSNKKSGSKYKYSVTVYYSGSSGAISSVTGYSNTSREAAKKAAWAKVPKTAQWASETKSQASNQTTGRVINNATSIATTNNAKTQSKKILQDSYRGTPGSGNNSKGGTGKVVALVQ